MRSWTPSASATGVRGQCDPNATQRHVGLFHIRFSLPVKFFNFLHKRGARLITANARTQAPAFSR